EKAPKPKLQAPEKFQTPNPNHLRVRALAKTVSDFETLSPSPRPSPIGWERENRAPRGCGSNRLGYCKRWVWLSPLPSGGRGSGRGSFSSYYASCPIPIFAQILSTVVLELDDWAFFGIWDLGFGIWSFGCGFVNTTENHN